MVSIIYFATLPNGYFGSSGISWKSLSLEKISFGLREAGYSVRFISIDEVDRITLQPNDVLIYTSSADAEIRAYVKDYVFLASMFCNVVPSYAALMAHENKGFQQIFRNKFKFGNLKGKYFVSYDQVPRSLPFVYKTVDGAGSAGVDLVSSMKDVKSLKKRFRSSLKRRILFLVRWLTLDKESFEIYKYRYQKKKLSISQEVIPNLPGDFKILAFGKSFFALKRSVKKGGFKASGSGKFSFPTLEEMPDGILDYAKTVFLELDVPYASLDIAKSQNGFHLIEYQATNFGPYTLVNSPRHFEDFEGVWYSKDEASDLEKFFSDALLMYVEKKFA